MTNMSTLITYRSSDPLDVKTTIGDAEALLHLVRELPIRYLVALERHAFESNSGPLERPECFGTAEMAVSAVLALEETARLFRTGLASEAEQHRE